MGSDIAAELIYESPSATDCLHSKECRNRDLVLLASYYRKVPEKVTRGGC